MFGDYMQVDLVLGEISSQNAARVRLYYKKSAGPDPTSGTIFDFAADFFTAYSGATPGMLPAGHTFRAVELVWRGPANTYVDGVFASAPIGGTVSGDVMPEENSIVFQRRTGIAGRQNRGRVFWPFVPESFADGSTLSPAAQVPCLAIAEMLSDDVVANGATFSPATPNFKQQILNPVVIVRFLSEICSRRDRRYVKRPVAISG